MGDRGEKTNRESKEDNNKGNQDGWSGGARAHIETSRSSLSLPTASTLPPQLNGQPLKEKKSLHHNDRVLFGSNNLFVFLNPANTATSPDTPEKVDWEFAQEELTRASGFGGDGKGDAEDQARMEKIMELLPMVNEVNAVAQEMDKHRRFEVALVSRALLQTTTIADFGTSKDSEVTVRVTNSDNGNEWILERGEFVDMRFRIQVRGLGAKGLWGEKKVG